MIRPKSSEMVWGCAIVTEKQHTGWRAFVYNAAPALLLVSVWLLVPLVGDLYTSADDSPPRRDLPFTATGSLVDGPAASIGAHVLFLGMVLIQHAHALRCHKRRSELVLVTCVSALVSLLLHGLMSAPAACPELGEGSVVDAIVFVGSPGAACREAVFFTRVAGTWTAANARRIPVKLAYAIVVVVWGGLTASAHTPALLLTLFVTELILVTLRTNIVNRRRPTPPFTIDVDDVEEEVDLVGMH